MTDNILQPPSGIEPDRPTPGPTGPAPGNHQPATVNAPPRFPQAQGESDRAFEAFRAYWELGPKRRYAAVSSIVGVSPRTVRRWAAVFGWRERIKTYAAHCAEQSAATENSMRRKEFLNAAARAQAFRERQYALAEDILAAAKRYLERLADDDLDQMRFSDACKALEVASRLGQQAASLETDDDTPARVLRDQLTALLDQACAEHPLRNGAAAPQTATHSVSTAVTPS